MAIAFESKQEATASAATSITVTKPTSLAVGDLMVAFTITTDPVVLTHSLHAGWTSVVDTRNRYNQSNRYMAFRGQFKIADSADVAASDFTFDVTGGTSDYIGGAIMRFTGNAIGTPLGDSDVSDQLNSATPSTWEGDSPTITPTNAESMILMFACGFQGASAMSSYAIATDDPSWTESFDTTYNDFVMACGYAVRTEITATGDPSFTNGGDATTDSGVILASFNPILNATVTPATLGLNDAVTAPTIAGGSVVAPDTVTFASAVPAPTAAQADWNKRARSGTGGWTARSKS